MVSALKCQHQFFSAVLKCSSPSSKLYVEKKDRSTRTQRKTGVNSVVPKGFAVPSPRVAPVVIAVVYTIHAQNITLIKA